MFMISKEFHFSAAHALTKCPDGHPCKRLHGHNYVIRLHLVSEELNELDFVQDYNDLKPFKEWVDTVLDHQNLNDLFEGPTTVEYMSRYVYQLWKKRLPKLVCVEMSETPKTACKYFDKEFLSYVIG